MKDKKQIVDKKTDFKTLIKVFFRAEQPETIDEQEVILKDTQLTEQEKNSLIKSLDRGDKLASRLFKENLKEENKKKSIGKIKNVKVDTDSKTVEKNKKIQGKEEKIQEI